MGYFPFFIEIAGKKCVVVGGGTVAVRKTKALLDYEATVTVVAPQLEEELQRLAADRKISIVKKVFEESDLADSFCVIAATNDSLLNNKISKLCKQKGILVNVADDKEKSTFLFPAYIREGNLSVGITTQGTAPAVASILKERFRKQIPEQTAKLLSKLEQHRKLVKEQVDSVKMRNRILRKLAELGMEQDSEITIQNVEEVIQNEIENWDKRE